MENESKLPVVTAEMIRAGLAAWHRASSAGEKPSLAEIYIAMHIHRPLSEGPR